MFEKHFLTELSLPVNKFTKNYFYVLTVDNIFVYLNYAILSLNYLRILLSRTIYQLFIINYILWHDYALKCLIWMSFEKLVFSFW